MPEEATDPASSVAEIIDDASEVVESLNDAIDTVSSPAWVIDLDRDNRKDVLVYKENGHHMVYISLRFTVLYVVLGMTAIYAWMCGYVDTLI